MTPGVGVWVARAPKTDVDIGFTAPDIDLGDVNIGFTAPGIADVDVEIGVSAPSSAGVDAGIGLSDVHGPGRGACLPSAAVDFYIWG